MFIFFPISVFEISLLCNPSIPILNIDHLGVPSPNSYPFERFLTTLSAGQTSEVAISNRNLNDIYYLALTNSNIPLTYDKNNVYIQSGDIITFIWMIVTMKK